MIASGGGKLFFSFLHLVVSTRTSFVNLDESNMASLEATPECYDILLLPDHDLSQMADRLDLGKKWPEWRENKKCLEAFSDKCHILFTDQQVLEVLQGWKKLDSATILAELYGINCAQKIQSWGMVEMEHVKYFDSVPINTVRWETFKPKVFTALVTRQQIFSGFNTPVHDEKFSKLLNSSTFLTKRSSFWLVLEGQVLETKDRQIEFAINRWDVIITALSKIGKKLASSPHLLVWSVRMQTVLVKMLRDWGEQIVSFIKVISYYKEVYFLVLDRYIVNKLNKTVIRALANPSPAFIQAITDTMLPLHYRYQAIFVPLIPSRSIGSPITKADIQVAVAKLPSSARNDLITEYLIINK